MRSPSVWRVWIEIVCNHGTIAYLYESPSVWRVWIEIVKPDLLNQIQLSPSVWRVWIEISRTNLWGNTLKVTLRVEGVD